MDEFNQNPHLLCTECVPVCSLILKLDCAYLSFLRGEKMFGQLFANSFFLLFGSLPFFFLLQSREMGFFHFVKQYGRLLSDTRWVLRIIGSVAPG